ncbi:MAG TPA: thiamine phosphate synthase [Candidatus Krumholzibacteria bacterium]|nr:thiamine phosphate synthase [Candidatus Krumholzibacteria bacterium]
MARRRIGRVCVITDTALQSRFDHVRLAELACAGGADTIQLRDKTLDENTLLAVARDVGAVCRSFGALFIVNDHVRVALEAGADGVHVGRGDTPVAAARRVLEPAMLIGATAHTREEATDAQRDGADYVGFGHIYATASKLRATPPVGLDALTRVCGAVDVPVLAIGGITAARAPEVLHSGAWGIAVIAEVCTAADPRAATENLRRAVDASLRER